MTNDEGMKTCVPTAFHYIVTLLLLFNDSTVEQI